MPVSWMPSHQPHGHQGKGSGEGGYQASPVSSHGSRPESLTAPEAVKVQQLVSLGIPRMDAEYLLNRTGGDVNAAAELQLSEMSSMSGPVHEATPQSAYPKPNESNPTDRRNGLSKTVR